MAQGLISKKYLIDMAEAIRVKLGSSDTYTPAQMANAISLITGEISGSITKSSNTDVGLITDTVLTGICDALRLKLDDSTLLLTPAQIADAILSIESGDVPVLPDLELLTESEYIQVWAQGLSSSRQNRRGSTGTTSCLYWVSNSSTPSKYLITCSQGNNGTSMFSSPIPSGYNYLYIDMSASGASGRWNLSTIYLRDAFGLTGYYGGQFTGAALKTITICNYGSTAEAINSQSGVTINSSSPYSLVRQTVIIDVSDINTDIWFGHQKCDNSTIIYSITAKQSLAA